MRLNGPTIPDAIVERVLVRHGAVHSFADLDPARTALVVIDLQRACMNEAVGFTPVPTARAIVPAVSRLAAAVREASGGMIWIKKSPDRRCFDDWSVAYEMAAPEVRAGAPALKIPLQAGEFHKAPWSRRILRAASS
jgi:ureidoacrylate peracid hydrolase